MANRTCSFCGANIEPGSGTVMVRKDGALLNFCSRKCRINMTELKRVPRYTKWTAEYHKIKDLKKRSSKQ
jgi:large subunit ribosomal protein L24e